MATFEILRQGVETWTGQMDSRRMSPKAAAKLNEYIQGIRGAPYGLKFNDGACSGPSCIRSDFYHKEWHYSLDTGFAGEVLGRYFAPEYVQALVAWKKEAQSPPKPVTVTYPPSLQKQGEGFWSSTVLWTSFGGLALFGWWLVRRKKEEPADPIPPLTTVHGSAQWAALQEKPLSATVVQQGVTFGKSSNPKIPAQAPGAPVASRPEAHTLIVARTRAGKGTRVIVPTLLRYGGSMLVFDPKGENAAITARTRRDQLGQSVYIVNPWGEMKELYGKLGFDSATFNPLAAIDRNDPNAVAVAQTLAATICPTVEGKDKFWQGSAANVLTGVFLWISDQPGEQQTLARAREIVTMSRADFLKSSPGW